MEFFTSDLHLGRTSDGESKTGSEVIFERTGRDKLFSSMEDYTSKIIENINNRCKKDDTLYILGDISCAEEDPTKYLKQINCRKILIIGNHDARWIKHRHFRDCFEEIREIKAIRKNGTRIVLCHYPLAEWDGFWKGHWHFYGHVHNSEEGAGKFMREIERAVNVGVDCNNYIPKTIEELTGLVPKEHE